jgi:SSS family solute:Na+ symporter
MVGAAVISFALAMVRPAELGLLLSNIASPGFAMWIPALLGGVLWKRGTKEGAITGLLVGLAWLIVGSFFYKPLLLGFHPIFVPLFANAILYVGVSLATSPVSQEVQHKFFDELEDYLGEYAALERSKSAKPFPVEVERVKGETELAKA